MHYSSQVSWATTMHVNGDSPYTGPLRCWILTLHCRPGPCSAMCCVSPACSHAELPACWYAPCLGNRMSYGPLSEMPAHAGYGGLVMLASDVPRMGRLGHPLAPAAQMRHSARLSASVSCLTRTASSVLAASVTVHVHAGSDCAQKALPDLYAPSWWCISGCERRLHSQAHS